MQAKSLSYFSQNSFGYFFCSYHVQFPFLEAETPPVKSMSMACFCWLNIIKLLLLEKVFLQGGSVASKLWFDSNNQVLDRGGADSSCQSIGQFNLSSVIGISLVNGITGLINA